MLLGNMPPSHPFSVALLPAVLGTGVTRKSDMLF
jgi:hypothetical protein